MNFHVVDHCEAAGSCEGVWSNNIHSVVVHTSELGVDATITEAITGVSKRSIQCLISEPGHCDGNH